MRWARFISGCLIGFVVACTEPSGVDDAPQATFLLQLHESAGAVAAIEIRVSWRRTGGGSRILLEARRSIGSGQHELPSRFPSRPVSRIRITTVRATPARSMSI